MQVYISYPENEKQGIIVIHIEKPWKIGNFEKYADSIHIKKVSYPQIIHIMWKTYVNYVYKLWVTKKMKKTPILLDLTIIYEYN